jgi:hypothetical protein
MTMRTEALLAATQGSGIKAGHAADLSRTPRFFKRTSSFDMQEKAFDAVHGLPGQPLPTDILGRVGRRLNDPDCGNDAALYSGAFHPTAEGHVIVADHVLRHVQVLREKSSLAEN